MTSTTSTVADTAIASVSEPVAPVVAADSKAATTKGTQQKRAAKAATAKTSVKPSTAAKAAVPPDAKAEVKSAESESKSKPKPIDGLQFFCSTSELMDSLPSVQRLTGTSNAILQGILFDVKKSGTLVLTGFNLESALRVSLSSDVVVPGAIVIPANLLVNLISQLPDEVIKFELDPSSSEMLITSSVGLHKMMCADAADYPALPQVKGGSMLLDAETLAEAIDYCKFSTSTDASKQVLQCLHLQLFKDGCVMASTDGHRLSRYNFPNSKNDARPDFLINVHRAQIAEIRRLCKGNEQVELTISDAVEDEKFNTLIPSSWIQVKANGATLITRLFDATYPNYENLIPKQFSRKITVNRAALLAAMQRVSLFRDVVKLSFNQAKRTVRLTTSSDSIGLGDETIEATVQGGDIDIAFNSGYLTEALGVMVSDEVTIEMNSATSPVVMEPISATPFAHLLMPVQIRG